MFSRNKAGGADINPALSYVLTKNKLHSLILIIGNAVVSISN